MKCAWSMRQSRMDPMNMLRYVSAVIGFVIGCAAAGADGQMLYATGPMDARPMAELAQATISPVEALSPKMQPADIAAIQQKLAARGYDPGPADGIAGARTVAAIRGYQAAAGLPVTGIARPRLLGGLRSGPVAANGIEVTPPEPGAMFVGLIEEVQIELQKRGYYLGLIDGIEGAATKSAIVQFQADVGYEANGRADARVLRQLLVADPAVRHAN